VADGLDRGHVRREYGEKLANCGGRVRAKAKMTNASSSAYRRKRMMVDTQYAR
jgi:hypothetical protein